MKKSLIATVVTISLFTGCTDDNTKTEAKSSVEQVKQEVAQTVEKKVEDVKQEEKKVETPKVEEKRLEEVKTIEAKKEEVAVVNDSNTEAIFKTCASCHGQKGEKEALGKSQVITGWDKDRTIKALNGYKDGSYGGVMKGIMKPHVESKTQEQIAALADFISKL